MDIRRWALGALALLTVGCNEGLPTAATQPELLEPGTVVTLNGGRGSTRNYRVTVPEGTGKLRILLAGFTGDADIAARFGAVPTESAVDCVSASEFAVEECIVDAPEAGTWFIQVAGFTAFSNAQLSADLFTQVGERSVTPGVAVTGLNGTSGGFEMFRLTVPSGADSLVVSLEVTGDADLYLDLGQYPLLNDYACASFTVTGSERCVIVAPPAGTWFVRVDGFTDYSAGTLLATVFSGSAVMAPQSLTPDAALRPVEGRELPLRRVGRQIGRHPWRDAQAAVGRGADIKRRLEHGIQ
jgi:hypothetical protein